MDALNSVPSEVMLGARKPENRLKLNAQVPYVYFGTGSEANFVLTSQFEEFVSRRDPGNVISHPVFEELRGSVSHLCKSAKLCNALSSVDFFIRNVNIQDEEIHFENKDVNVFMASLMYMTKHVQAGLVNLEKLDDVVRLAEIVAGGKLEDNPVISFIVCAVKSPLQMVEDTTDKLIELARRKLPQVLSSSPQGGSTAPIREEGMTALINAEILASITLTQLINPGTPVLYGAVPVRTRQDNLHDLYGAPEFIHYNVDCIQMARYYSIPCYSSAGVGDAKVPGMQATVEKLFAQLEVAAAGAQYIHYAFGLLDKTNVFSPLQAVLDDAHIQIIKTILQKPAFGQEDVDSAINEIRHVTSSSGKLFAKYIRKARRLGLVSEPYGFESHVAKDEVLQKAYEKQKEIMGSPDDVLEGQLIDSIYKNIPGLLPRQAFLIDE